MATRTKEPNAAETRALREEWLQAVEELIAQITDWSRGQGWTVQRSENVLNEKLLGTYTVSILTIEAPEGKLKLEPIGRDTIGNVGRVELYAWPTLYRVLLLYKPSAPEWVIWTDSGIPLRRPWNEDTFITLAKDLLRAE